MLFPFCTALNGFESIENGFVLIVCMHNSFQVPMADVAAVINYYHDDLIKWFEVKFKNFLTEYDAQSLSVIAAFHGAEDYSHNMHKK